MDQFLVATSFPMRWRLHNEINFEGVESSIDGAELSITPTTWKANIQVEELVYPEVKWGGETGNYNPRDENNDPNNANYNYDSNYVNKFEGDIINYGLNLKAAV